MKNLTMMQQIKTVMKWFLGIIAFVVGQQPVPQKSGTRSRKQRPNLSNPLVTILMVVVGVVGMSEVSWGQITITNGTTTNASAITANTAVTINAGGTLNMDVSRTFSSLTTANTGTSTVSGNATLTLSGNITVGSGNTLA
ncbi:MAG: hypothetical protein ACK560_10250, partial [Bacteroidota bacterium]